MGKGAYLGAEAVSQSTNLGGTVLLLQGLDGGLDDGIDGLLGMGVVSIAALGHPAHEVEVVGAVKRERVAVEDVENQGEVALGGQLVGHELGVLPDADDVGEEKEGLSGLLGASRLGDVGIPLVGDLGHGAGRLAPGRSKLVLVTVV